jgi:hypothetical protein
MTNLFRPILRGGLFCALLDFVAVTTFYALKGVPAIRVWQAVASGLWGTSAFLRGWTSGAVGIGVHLIVAFSASAVFCLAACQLPALAQRYLLYGPIYGVSVFLFMNFVVVPLSAMPKRPVPAGIVIAQLIIHIFCVGLPISFSTQRFTK